MDGRLLMQALGKLLSGALLTALLLFAPAGSLNYQSGWVLMAALFIPMLIAGFIMLFRCPALLRKRLCSREAEPEQRRVVALCGLMFAAAFIAAGLGWRFGWPTLPGWLRWAGLVALLIGYALYAETLRENAWLSRTIEVQQGQRVVDTGLYGVVRHPMYAATLALFLSMPLVLGSPAALAIMLGYVPLIVRRIRSEEALLAAGLEGYAAYMSRVRYRLLPHIW